MKDNNCLFCKLANGEIPTNTLYEDDMFRVIFDLSPATKGHAIIIPKEHYKNLYELSDEVAERVMLVAKKLAIVMTELFDADGFNLIQNNNECAGQTVFHFHLHLIPRYEGDKVNKFWNPGEADEEKLKEWSRQITEALS